MGILAVIPARYASQRFPGKPLTLIAGRPMVQWVYEAASSCSAFDHVLVATDSEQVAECVRSFGGAVELTGSHHETGTDRVAEVAQRYPEMEVVVNVQGDQPFVTAEMLTSLVQPYLNGQTPSMATLACPIDIEQAHSDPNSVKVICNQRGEAIYFSRAAIPYFRNPGAAPVYHHLGLYAFSRSFLLGYSALSQTPLERCEGLEQLRALEHGYAIAVSLTPSAIPEVNTPEDLALVEAYLVAKGIS